MMVCPRCGSKKSMKKSMRFVSKGALIPSYNYASESELKTVNGVLGKDIPEWQCIYCGVFCSTAG